MITLVAGVTGGVIGVLVGFPLGRLSKPTYYWWCRCGLLKECPIHDGVRPRVPEYHRNPSTPRPV